VTSGEERPLSLVVGGDGRIGAALRSALERDGAPVLATTRRSAGPRPLRLDLAAAGAGWAPPEGAATAFLCAGVTSLHRCERERARCRRINVEATLALARRLVEGGAFVVFPSTNLVYDGSRPGRRAQEPPCPTTAYGALKAEAERGLLALGPSVAVVRLTKVIDARLPLLRDWIRSLRAGRPVLPFRDLVMAPVSLETAARVLLAVGHARRGGIYQLSADADVSYAEAARHLARRLGAPAELVRARTSSEAGVGLAARPAHTTLDTRRLREELGLPTPAAASALDALLV
jgi:dTDP-4-dehydrorhamnose reductase